MFSNSRNGIMLKVKENECYIRVKEFERKDLVQNTATNFLKPAALKNRAVITFELLSLLNKAFFWL